MKNRIILFSLFLITLFNAKADDLVKTSRIASHEIFKINHKTVEINHKTVEIDHKTVSLWFILMKIPYNTLVYKALHPSILIKKL